MGPVVDISDPTILPVYNIQRKRAGDMQGASVGSAISKVQGYQGVRGMPLGAGGFALGSARAFLRERWGPTWKKAEKKTGPVLVGSEFSFLFDPKMMIL